MLNLLMGYDNIKDAKVSERVKKYEASCSIEKGVLPNFKCFQCLKEIVPKRDKITITFINENEEVLDILDKDMYESFVSELFDGELVRIKVSISKSIVEGKFSIYSFEAFSSDLLSQSIEQVMRIFSNLLKETEGQLIFEVFSPFTLFKTKTMCFVSHESNTVLQNFFVRSERINNCKEASYFYNFDAYEIIPDDFKIEVDYKGNPLTKLFNRVETILSLVFLANSSSIERGHLKGTINGQRTIEYQYPLDEEYYNNVVYDVYNWIYTDGCTIDKAIIARNVLSLHCQQTQLKNLHQNVFGSIQSNYNLYLKNNVVQYLELKNKVSEFINNQISKTGEYATKLFDKFLTNLAALFGFLLTVNVNIKMPKKSSIRMSNKSNLVCTKNPV